MSRLKRKLSAPGLQPQKKTKINGSSTASNSKQAAGQNAVNGPRAQDVLLDKSPFPEALQKDDRQRLAQLYGLLGDSNEANRNRAVEVILAALFDGDGVPPDALIYHLEKRLFAGLASSKHTPRIGRSFAIAEVLKCLFGERNLATTRYSDDRLRFEALLASLIEWTTPKKETTDPHGREGSYKQQENDYLRGQIAGLEGFVSSGIAGEESRWSALFPRLLALAQKKDWLRYECSRVISQALPQLDKNVVKKTLRELSESGIAETAEGIGVWLAAAVSQDDLKLPKPWKHPLSSKTLDEVAKVLHNSNKEPTGQQFDRGEGQKDKDNVAKAHFVWNSLIRLMYKRYGDDATGFERRWSRLVDGRYLPQSHPHNSADALRNLFLGPCYRPPEARWIQSIPGSPERGCQHGVGCDNNPQYQLLVSLDGVRPLCG
jgi:DNA polymerase phi